MPERPGRVKFAVSAPAAAVIRDRGGQLWIWPSPDGSAYATTEPPGETREWTAYRQAGFVVHGDEAIVAPQRWVVTRPEDGGRHLEALWNGEDRGGALGQLPLVEPPDAPSSEKWKPTDPSPWYRRISRAEGLLGAFLGTIG